MVHDFKMIKMGPVSQTNIGVRKKNKKSQISVAEIYLPLGDQKILYEGGSWVPPLPSRREKPKSPPKLGQMCTLFKRP